MSKTNHTDVVHVLATAAPTNSNAYAEEVARKYFGVECSAELLTSERDQNFMLSDEKGPKFVLKFTNPAEDRQVTNFQTEAMIHIAEVDPDLPVPRIHMSVDGESEVLVETVDGQMSLVRLISFLSGVPLAKVAECTSELRRNNAHSLARLGLALRGFFHPAAGHELLWDLKHASRLRDLFIHIEDEDKRALVTHYLDDFEQYAVPLMPKLRAQVIHNDLNTTNTMVDEETQLQVTGIIDFGDMVHAPLINDLAVAAAYHLDDSSNPLSTAAEFVGAYHEICPLEEQEVGILYDLIVTRLVMTVAITGWRAARYPENRDYILRHNPMSWTRLEHLSKFTREQAICELRRACKMEN